jgi:hypothetical protein
MNLGFISDLHLSETDTSLTNAFIDFLKSHSSNLDQLYILEITQSLRLIVRLMRVENFLRSLSAVEDEEILFFVIHPKSILWM